MTAFSDTLAPTEDVWPGYNPVRDPIGSNDHLLPPPDPAQRLDFTVLSAADQRRLDLYAALTVRGIAPRPGDRYAVDAISSLGDAVTDSVLRWITHRS